MKGVRANPDQSGTSKNSGHDQNVADHTNASKVRLPLACAQGSERRRVTCVRKAGDRYVSARACIGVSKVQC